MGAQLALLAGCHVVATCGSARKAERLRSLGIHRVINYEEEVLSVILICHGLNMHASHHPTCISASASLGVSRCSSYGEHCRHWVQFKGMLCCRM